MNPKSHDSVIRPSHISKWMGCEKRELHKFQNPEYRPSKGVINIAQWVGTAVHALCNDEPMPEFPKDKYISYDSVTQTQSDAQFQAKRMAKILIETSDEQGLIASQREVETRHVRRKYWPYGVYMQGTIDLIGRMRNGDAVIADIKTGANAGGGWMQMGAYANICAAEDRIYADRLAIIHLPRSYYDIEPVRPTYEYRDAAPIMEEAQLAADRIASLMSGEVKPVASPGTSCRSCTIQCPVRAHDAKPRT